MQNILYINFSAENSNSDSWVSELISSFGIMLEKISNSAIQIIFGLGKDDIEENRLDMANLIILVFNGFISDEFSKDLRELEVKHQDFLDAGKEIFVVVKSPKFLPIIPVYLRKYVQYNFFEINIRTNEVIEYSPFLKGEKEGKFWSKLTDLAYDSKMFFDVRNGLSPVAVKAKVYLADISKDQVNNRENLKREFLLSGYKVMPVRPLPASLKEYREAAGENIKLADFSIHIMGELYGDCPSGSDYSYPEIQNKLVTEMLSQSSLLKNNFYRFIWLPPNLEPYDEKQVQYLKRLKRELNTSSSGEIIQCSIEEFKEIIIQKINTFKFKNIFLDEPLGKKVVLLIDRPDESIYQKVVSQIKLAQKEYELIDLTRTGDLLPLAMFQQTLRSSDAAIIMNLTAKANWMSGMLGLAIKNFYGNKKSSSKPIAALSYSKNKADINFDGLNIDYIALDDSHFSERLEKFLTQIQ